MNIFSDQFAHTCSAIYIFPGHCTRRSCNEIAIGQSFLDGTLVPKEID